MAPGMKRLFVCGDSWFTTDPENQLQSVAGQLADRHNLQLTSFARVGCSNFAIALQVNQAIKHIELLRSPPKSNLVIVGATTPDRIELPIIDKSIWDKLKQFFDWKGWFHYQPGVYLRRRGLANVKYARKDLSTHHSFLTEPTIISESINNLAFNESGAKEAYGLDQERIDALKLYMVNLYDTYVKRQYDSWIISDAVRRLKDAGIPFLVYTAALYDGEYIEDITWAPRENLIMPEDFDYYSLPISGASMSHLDTHESGVFANYLTDRMKQLGFINE